MREQEQFLQVLDRDEAERRFRAALDLKPRDIERIPLDAALGRVLAAHVVSPVDVPSFDRSNVDGFAVVAEDTFAASEEVPRIIALADEHIHTGIVPTTVIHPGKAVAIATGGMVPRGADAVVMMEYAEARGAELRIARAVTPGSGVSFAGTDITAGETVLRRGRLLTSRDTGVLAAIGVSHVNVWRRLIVAILSTGDEIIAPGEPMSASAVTAATRRSVSPTVSNFPRAGTAAGDLRAAARRMASRTTA
jgi:putative molybdopterin biosynthesis protein